MMASPRFNVAQVCQIVSGEDGETDYMFPGSDDELDALELNESDEDDLSDDREEVDEPMDLEGDRTRLDTPGSNSCKLVVTIS